MKKINFLMLWALAFLLSCRTDQFPEQEAYNNSPKFQLTSKRISLNESKHKSILLPEIEKAEAAFKNSKTNVNGRVIDYGNGVSIDTDDVIYIENGPNYHTYTFHVNRDNAPADAPLENLLLVPLPGGKYNEFLITYNLTLAEKERLKAGLPIDTNGKSQVTKLTNGTFNFSGQLAKLSCTEVSETIWQDCGEHVHNKTNVEDWINCKAAVKPRVYTLVTMNCINENDDIITPIDPGGSSGGGPGGIYTPPPSNGNTPPCTGTVVPTNPQPGFTDQNGCPIGAPSLPNLPMSFTMIVRSLPADVKTLLNSNTQFYQGLENYYNANQNLQGENFVRWAAQNVTWTQFQNWFIDGYNNAYRTKLSLLSSEEIQEFVNINTEIDASPYDEEFVKETNEAFVAFTAYGDIDTMTDVQMETVLNQCCPSVIIVPQAMTLEKTRMIVATYKFNRKFYPEWSKGKCFWEASRETIQLLLDLGGLVPVIGEVCDLTNGVIYTIQGDGLNAGLSYASAIPVAGWFAAGTKYGVKVVNASDIASKQVLKWIIGNDGLVKFGYSSQLRKVLNLTDITKQAHHIIPWAYSIQIHPVVQKAAKSANAFHLNEALNGIAVASWRNQPNHHAYNNKILGKLEAFRISNPNATPDQCYNELIDIISDARQAIINNPNTHLNNLVF